MISPVAIRDWFERRQIGSGLAVTAVAAFVAYLASSDFRAFLATHTKAAFSSVGAAAAWIWSERYPISLIVAGVIIVVQQLYIRSFAVSVTEDLSENEWRVMRALAAADGEMIPFDRLRAMFDWGRIEASVPLTSLRTKGLIRDSQHFTGVTGVVLTDRGIHFLVTHDVIVRGADSNRGS